MSIYTFIRIFTTKHPHDHYFDTDTLKFFGERISDMRILKKTVYISDICGDKHCCYVLSKVSKNFSGQRFRNYDYFDVDTLERITK